MSHAHESAVWSMVYGKCAEECRENMDELLRIRLSEAIRRFADGGMQLDGLSGDVMLLWFSIDNTPEFSDVPKRDLRAVKAFVFAITESEAFLTAMRMH